MEGRSNLRGRVAADGGMVPAPIRSGHNAGPALMADPLDRRVLIRNAAANLAGGVAGAVLAVVLPPFLVRLLDRDTYSVWALLLQIGGYTGLLNFGLQTAVGRFIAHAEARQDFDQRDRIVSTAVALLTGSAVISVLVIFGLAALLPRFFPAIPAPLQVEAQVALLWVGGSLALGLPFTVFNGVFVGLQRNEVPAVIIVVGRLTTALGLVLAAASGHGLVAMAIVFAGINLLTYGAQWMAIRRFVPTLLVSRQSVSRDSFRELVDYCTSLTVWSFAMLLVSGLDLALVARFDFPAVGAFAIASGLLALLIGAQSAVMSVFLPAGAALDAQGNRERLGDLLLSTTRWNLLLLGAAMGAYCLLKPILLNGYVGPDYATKVAPLLDVLFLATAIRLSMLPYNMLAMGAGDHRRIILGPLAEGISNIVASVVLGWRFGAIGVAWGTVLGGTIGVAFHLGLNLPRSFRLGVPLRRFAIRAFLPATLAVFPLMMLLVIEKYSIRLSNGQVRAFSLMAIGVFLILGWNIVLQPSEKKIILSKVRSK